MSIILHVSTGLNDGGAEAILHRVCINEKQHRHIVVSMMDEGKYGPLLKEAGIEVYCLNSARGRLSFKTIRSLWRIIRDCRPAVVQTWMYHANLIGGISAYCAGVRRIIWSIRHAHLSADDSKFTTRLVDRLSAILSHVIPNRIIAISNNVADVHLSKGYASKFSIIHNGCDTEVFFPNSSKSTELLKEFNMNPGIPIIGCVARWTPEKDHGTFLKAAALALQKCELQVMLVGTGCSPENEALVDKIKNLDIEGRVFLIGPRNDIPDIMNLLDIHVLPSKNEAFGNVLIEAMACGTPCISTNVSDAEYIIGNTGWVVDRQDPIMMSEAITSAISVMSVGNSRQERKDRSRDRVINQFSVEKMVQEYNMAWADHR